MARSSLKLSWIVLAALVATPAFGQFGSIFGEEAPRPPADVPNRPSSTNPNYPPPPPANYPSRIGPRPPGDVRSDEPPERPLPAPMNLPPASRPGASSIESAPLAPLPGTQLTPQAPLPAPQQDANQPPMQTLPGNRQPRGAPQQPANTAPQPGDEVVVAPPPQRIANPTAVFSGLDKITGRIISFDVAIDETVQFGALQVTPRVCYSRPPTETPNTDAFVEVDEVTLQGEIKRIFTGWMFAASPGLHAVEHPIYDVWVTDCKGGKNPNVAEAPAEPTAPKQPARPAPRQQPRNAPQPRFPPPLR